MRNYLQATFSEKPHHLCQVLLEIGLRFAGQSRRSGPNRPRPGSARLWHPGAASGAAAHLRFALTSSVVAQLKNATILSKTVQRSVYEEDATGIGDN